MMSPSLKTVSSLKSLLHTIDNDFYTYRWFGYLFKQLRRREAYAQDACFVKQFQAYRLYDRISFASVMLSIMIVLLPFYAVFSFRGYLTLLPLGLAYFFFLEKMKSRLQTLAEYVLNKEFDAKDFKQKTLYHIIELLSQRYGLVSLVDTMAFSNNILRRYIILGIVMPWPSYGRSLATFFVLYPLIKVIMNRALVYSCLFACTKGNGPQPDIGQSKGNTGPDKDIQRTGVRGLKAAMALLHSFVTPVFLFFYLDFSALPYYFPEVLTMLPVNVLLVSIHLVYAIIFAGFYGALIDLATGQTPVVTFRLIGENIKRLWVAHLAVFAVFQVIKFSVYSPGLPLAGLVYTWMDIAYLLCLAYVLFMKKFQRSVFRSFREAVFRGREIATMFFLGALIVCVYMIYKVLLTSFFYGAIVSLLLIKYMSLLLFTYTVSGLARTVPERAAKAQKAKELLIISPMLGGNVFFGLLKISSPIINKYLYLILRCFTPQEYSIQVLANRFWQRRYCQPDRLVAITCYTTQIAEAYKIAKDCKQGGAKVVMGGPHVHFLPDEALMFCDSVVIGEAEAAWPEVVKDYESQSLKPVYSGTASQEDYQKVQQALLDAPASIVKESLEPTRGCKFKCDFCVVPSKNQKVCTKPLEDFIVLVEKVKGAYRHVYLMSDNIYLLPSYTRDLLKALIPMEISWSANSSIDIAAQDEMIDLLKQSGCRRLSIGYEIVKPQGGAAGEGKLKLVDKYIEYSRRLKQNNIRLNASFIFGFDQHTYQTLLDYWLFFIKIYPDILFFGPLAPFPGTKVFERMIKEDRLADMNWNNYEGIKFVFYPKRMNYRLLNILFPFCRILMVVTSSRLGLLMAGLVGLFVLLAVYLF